jgi:hypothetical protein
MKADKTTQDIPSTKLLDISTLQDLSDNFTQMTSVAAAV